MYNKSMKLLLTSAGITNDSISKALFDLVGKKPEDTSLVFIPTASNIENGDKSWLIDDLVQIKKQNFKHIEIADISALPEDVWRPRFEEADVLFFEGGDVYHLMEWINNTGLRRSFSELLKTKVWVGVSAGSMVTCPTLSLNISKIIYGENLEKTEDMKALGLVDFYFLPHLNSKYFEEVRVDKIEEVIKDLPNTFYALDDDSAMIVVDGKIDIVSEGVWKKWN